jgi:FtsH-binding integral membrane protein
MIFAFAPFVFVMVFSFKINSMQASTARAMLLVYSGLMGVSLAPVLMIYTGESIAKAFFTTSALFGAMSLYGYTTKRDLTSFGSFMFMGLIGILIASLVNMFLHSGPLDFAISILGVVIFTGLTAWDVQKITRLYDMLPSGEMRNKAAVMGALSLYMDFVNLFLYLLRFMGDKKHR